MHALDRQLVDLKVGQTVLALEFRRAADTRCADVDACDLSRGPAQRMLGRLRRPAAGDEDGLVFPIRSGRPQQMIFRAPSWLVLPEESIFFQIIGGRRIRVTVIEVSDLLCHITDRREVVGALAHDTCPVSSCHQTVSKGRSRDLPFDRRITWTGPVPAALFPPRLLPSPPQLLAPIGALPRRG